MNYDIVGNFWINIGFFFSKRPSFNRVPTFSGTNPILIFIFGQKYVINIIIVLIITVIVYVYLKYSKHGYEISVVGESQNTARYVFSRSK